MKPKRGNVDVESGVFFTLSGLITMLLSMNYSFGTAARMGPGFFPIVLSGLLTFLGIAILVSGLRTRKPVVPSAFDLKSVLIVCTAIVLFGLLLMRAGLLITVPLTVVVASFAQHEMKWKQTLVIAVALTVFTWLVFIAGLDLRIPLLPRFV
ncbi:tripartite tricarboxylate transporter TctB family protein [Shinella granuli]|uniref:Tripartite tricarboxylate transporter TctB family protein n=1 Tax=Shinella granuli TaxID=323621 RepID=A0A4R2C6P0_SHIGR|nr:tripartite tricarboxylate transporter TctB family protein [Shinella granuli]TCN35425.1 tripartite tricarboxylate transporter TctB family protein [Shinella granuli]